MKPWPAVRTAAGVALSCAILAIVALAAMEVYLRLTIPGSTSASIFEYTLDTRRYKVMRASASVSAWGKELRTNRLGFRDHREAIGPKRPGELRIVVLGDSFTVSAGVDYERIYTRLLERRLRQAHPQMQVINLAVAGYNVLQYELVLQEVALALEPDLVLVALFPTNDFSNETLEENLRRARGEPEPAAPAWHKQLYVYQAWLGRAEARLRSLLLGFDEMKLRDQRQAGGDPMVADWDENISALQRIATAARARGIAVAVTALPHTYNFDRQRALNDRVLRYCALQGIPAFDMLRAFTAGGVREASLRLNAIDSHPNEAYNALVAQHLAGYLDARLSVVPSGAGATRHGGNPGALRSPTPATTPSGHG